MLRRGLKLFIPFLIVFLLDQLTKYLALSYLSSAPFNLIDDFLRLNLVYNEGAAFSLLAGNTIFLLLTSLAAMIFIILLSFVLPLNASPFLGLILGGAFSNFYDRLRLGYVVDMIDFKFWPVFNVADIFIVIGTLGLALFLLLEKSD